MFSVYVPMTGGQKCTQREPKESVVVLSYSYIVLVWINIMLLESNIVNVSIDQLSFMSFSKPKYAYTGVSFSGICFSGHSFLWTNRDLHVHVHVHRHRFIIMSHTNADTFT